MSIMELLSQYKSRFLLLSVIVVLAACSAGGQDSVPEPGVTTLIYAQLSESGVDREAVDTFNRAHEGEVQIEVRDYTQLSESGRQGVDLLMTEIAAGKVPDIIELGTYGETSLLPYQQFAEKGYLEDLWPYIEADPNLGRDGVMEAPLKAVEINGGLYTVFDSVRLHTLVGSESVLGSRTNWTVEDLLDALDSMPEEAVFLDNYMDYPSMKSHLLSSFLYGFSDLFIDWETGRCSFDGEEFRTVLELANRMPNEYEWRKKCPTQAEARELHIERIMDGIVMLEDIGFGSLAHLKNQDFYFGQAVFVGYPVGDGSTGSYFRPTGIKLSMSSTCRDKASAWEYIRRTLLPRPNNYLFEAIPINRAVYERERKEARQGVGTFIGGETIDFGALTKKDCYRIETLYNSTTRSSLLMDKDVLDLVVSTAGPYFAGDKSLNETAQLIQNRVTLYVNEQK